MGGITGACPKLGSAAIGLDSRVVSWARRTSVYAGERTRAYLMVVLVGKSTDISKSVSSPRAAVGGGSWRSKLRRVEPSGDRTSMPGCKTRVVTMVGNGVGHSTVRGEAERLSL